MKIALILNDDFSMWHFRGGLIKALVHKGMDVCVIVPPGSYVSKLEAMGARCIPIAMNRFITPVQDLKLLFQLYSVFRAERFDLVHNMTIKPNIFGTLAAKLAGIKRIVCLVSGIGYVFSEEFDSTKKRIVRKLATFLYKLALSISDKTWFQNKDDLELFIEKGIIKAAKGLVIRSGGINLNEFSLTDVNSGILAQLRQELQIKENPKCVVMVAARLIWSKGVREFVEASELLKAAYPDWIFLMVCPQDPGSPDSVPQDYIDAHRADNLIVIDYFRDDIKNIIALADIMVLVSYYREGVPRTLLEGLSMSKPIIASNSVGCKEVVEDGKNGFLVPVKDAKQLAEKLRYLMDDEDKRHLFGKYSRELAKKCFDETIVVNRILTELYEIA
ncbi:glycosyltransferase family 4 protein [Microcoleus sp. FACHB-SPT15]|uniref:glycosyltransferase family 4 protein n=1 Tax=Microcoleus sp. FACHB-SPT15 TaxID=2692830 RepID=UPI0017816038|nr:glycosyltransferase family 4 protein [Microcoleus sp. FACHB-SPT15]MBD1806564.1 glycosyltransferase family 4 protein [Microcoleus sp. FACHB-SPT15]